MKMDFEDCWLSRKNLGLQSVNSKKKNRPFQIRLISMLSFWDCWKMHPYLMRWPLILFSCSLILICDAACGHKPWIASWKRHAAAAAPWCWWLHFLCLHSLYKLFPLVDFSFYPYGTQHTSNIDVVPTENGRWKRKKKEWPTSYI